MSRTQKKAQKVNRTEPERTRPNRPAQTAAATLMRRRLGRAIRDLRQQAKINQGQLASKLELGQANVSRYESGQQWVESVERLRDVAQALDVPLWVLFLTAELGAEEFGNVKTIAACVQTVRRLSSADQKRVLAALKRLAK